MGRAAAVPEPTIRPALRSVSNSETQNVQLALFDVSLLLQNWSGNITNCKMSGILSKRRGRRG